MAAQRTKREKVSGTLFVVSRVVTISPPLQALSALPRVDSAGALQPTGQSIDNEHVFDFYL